MRCEEFWKLVSQGAVVGIFLYALGAALLGIEATPRAELGAAVLSAIVTALWLCYDNKSRKT